MHQNKLFEKKIITIQQEELLFLRESILKIYGLKIDSPGDKASYEPLSKDITEKLNIGAIEQRHSNGLLHKLLHDEGHNRDFIDACYRYITKNKYDRAGFFNANEFPKQQTESLNLKKILERNKWKKRFILLLTIFIINIGFASIYYGLFLYNESNKTIIWNMSTAWSSESHTYNVFLEDFAKKVKEETKGKLDIRIYPDYQLPTSNGHSKNKEEVFEALKDGSIDMIHSSSIINFTKYPAEIMFSSIPFGKNYEKMTSWMAKPKIKKELKYLFINEGILTFPGGHSGLQYGGWYKELPTNADFFNGKTVRFANLAGYLLKQTSIGAKLKPMMRFQFESMIVHINYDVVEWQNPEEDLKLNMNLKGFGYYDSSNWNEPNSMFRFYISKNAINQLPKDIQNTLLRIIDKIGQKKVFSENTVKRQLAENIIENSIIPKSNTKIKIFNMQHDCPKTYEFLKKETDNFLFKFVSEHPEIKWLFDDYNNSK
jgi:TRAP-type mannitol/chloroaromatic compound transport system substrate-binding protein